ncbi:MAG: helicase [Legionellales bacterium]|nr:helicase [Legionellales bacterium]
MFADDGPLAKHIEGFKVRAPQLTLSESIETAIKEQQALIAEAGTGTGKTFAYLVPALLSGKKVIISTGTKTLQDQLFKRDLPIIRDALGLPIKVSLLKGRSNYLCLHRLSGEGIEHYQLDKATLNDLQEVRRKAGRTQHGDIAELTSIPEDAKVWPIVTSTNDNCLGADCPAYNDCYLVKARRQAMDADVVVVNHHLFFADMSLKEDKFGELLPKAEVIILDEAHQLGDVASKFLGQTLTSRRITELLNDTEVEAITSADGDKQLLQAIDRLRTALAELRLQMGEMSQRAPWDRLKGKSAWLEAKEHFESEWLFLVGILEKLASRAKGLENCWERATELLQTFKQLTANTPEQQIHWYETFSKSFSLNFTPLSVAEPFNDYRAEQEAAWIFTSATLAVGDDFSHFSDNLGIDDAKTVKLDSPFDFARQGIFYVPRDLPDPNNPAYNDAVLAAALPVLRLTGGRAFFLFTSFKALHHAAEVLASERSFELFIQGDQPKSQLLAAFRQSKRGVLLGTSSFWEGVDVRGEALSCVIIDKLPFATPDDPILKARASALRQQGKIPFLHYHLPNSIIALKQGAGRLIRDVEDRGILMICDPRLVAKDYGRSFIQSLPPMTRTRDFAKVRQFFERQHEIISD